MKVRIEWVILLLILSWVVLGSSPACLAEGNIEVRKAGTGFAIGAPWEAWEMATGGTPVYSQTLQFGFDYLIPVNVYILYNENYLFWGFLVRDPKLRVGDDFTPQFSGSDHLKLWFKLGSYSNERADSLFILPNSIFQEPIVVEDYDFYRNQPGFNRSAILVETEIQSDYYFITMAIPFVALKVSPPKSGELLHFDLELYQTQVPGVIIDSAWLGNNAAERGKPISVRFR